MPTGANAFGHWCVYIKSAPKYGVRCGPAAASSSLSTLDGSALPDAEKVDIYRPHAAGVKYALEQLLAGLVEGWETWRRAQNSVLVRCESGPHD